MTKRISSFILILSFFTAIIAFVSCKKELSFNLNNKFKISEKFFNNPHSTNKIVLRVIDEIKKRNDKNEFVSEFAISNGYPIWDKPVISIPSNQSYKVNSINNVEISQTDTFAYFPIVIENSDQINGFILAKINNGIELIYSLSKDYKAFSFLNDGSNLNDASKFVLTNLLLNKEVFGVAEYEIIDNRLFTGDPEHDVASKLSIEGQLNAGDCVIINWQTNHCGTPTTACCTDSDGCDGLNGTCPTGQCYMNNSSVEICTAPNGVNWPSGGIGVSTTGGGSGGSSGGGEIPHYYPCQSNSFLKPSDPIPPCPEPGPGSGWNPIKLYQPIFDYSSIENPIPVPQDEPIIMPPGLNFQFSNFSTVLQNSLKIIGSVSSRGNTEDLTYGTNGNTSGILSNMPYFQNSELFNEMTDLIHFFSVGDLEVVGDNMITRFRNNLGGEFSDPNLSLAVYNSSALRNFLVKFGENFNLSLENNNWDINQVPKIIMSQSTRPVFNRPYNKFTGLQILLNDTEETKIELTSFRIDNITHKWTACINLVIYDHFGLDKKDALMYQNYNAGFAAWWILQHCRGYKPFITKVSFNMDLSSQ